MDWSKPTLEKAEKELETAVKKPAFKVRAADVSCAAWENHTDKGDYISCKLERVYTTEQGEKKNTQNLGLGDIPKAVAVLQAVYAKYGLKEVEK